MNITTDEILTLMDKLSATGLGELSLSDNDIKLTIKAKKQIAPQPIQPIGQVQATQIIAQSPDVIAIQEEPKAAIAGNVVKSPIVGTFYSAPAPDKPNYVEVGSKVKKGDVLFIIESMKLMNEITSEFDGVVTDILTESGAGVEYAQPIMVIN